MKRGPYKKYLDPTSNNPIPRTTKYNLKKQKKMQCNEVDSSSSDLEEYHPSAIQPDCLSHNDEDNNDYMPIDEYEESTTDSRVHWNQFDITFDDDNDGEDNDDINSPDIWFDAEDDTLPFTPNNEATDRTEETYFDNKSAFFLGQLLSEFLSITKGETVLMVLLLGVKHCLTWEAITDILVMINSIFGRDVVPATKHLLFKYFPISNDVLTYHLYCSQCQSTLGKRSDLNVTMPLICSNCEKNIEKTELTFFLTLNLETQLKQLLENPEVQKELFIFKRMKKNEDALEDIYDGQIYKQLSAEGQPLASKFNLSYMFNSDGCQTGKSSKISIWPIYIMILELPPKLREKHILMSGLWVSNEEPNMHLFLQSFVEHANLLSTEGVKWKLDNEIITSKILPMCGCFDSVARCKVLNMKQYNGYYGCTFCQHPGIMVEGNIKFPILKEKPNDRTDDSIKATMLKIHEEKLTIDFEGIWGPSALMNLNYFNLVEGMVPEYMHSVLLGVTKQYTEIILTTVDADFYVGQPAKLLQINNRLLTIQHPSSITRSARKLEDRSLWKASEWRSWLLFYSLICLEGILDKKYLDHLALLVSAIEILLSDCLTSEIIDRADELLIKFVYLYQKYFGKTAMTYNVHLLLPLRKSVDNWGPLWTHNTFCFENENRLILQLKKSPAFIGLQIAKRYFFYKSLTKFQTNCTIGENYQLFCERTLTEKLKNVVKVDNCLLIGNGKVYVF